MLVQVEGEGSQDAMRMAGGIEGVGQVMVQTTNGHAQGADGAFGAVGGAARVSALEFGDGFQFAQGFGFDRLRLAVVIEQRLEFALFAEQSPTGLDFIQIQIAFLQTGPALERLRCAGKSYRRGAGAGLILAGAFCGQVQRVDRLGGWMRE